MSLRSISVSNPYGSMVIPLNDEDDPELSIVSIDGLGPPESTINISGGPTFDGGIYNSAKVNSRTISLTLKVGKTGKAGDLVREKLYRLFPAKGVVTITATTDSRVATAVGIVKSNTVNMFSSIQNAVVTLEVPSSFFLALGTETILYSGTTPMFTFPFYDNIADAPSLIFGEVFDILEYVVNYTGDVPTGLIFRFDFSGPVGDVTFVNNGYGEIMTIDVDIVAMVMGSPIQAGDRITIDTRSGRKSATLLRYGTEYNILHALGRTGTWIKLYPGDNPIVYSTESEIYNVSLTIEHETLYEGV